MSRRRLLIRRDLCLSLAVVTTTALLAFVVHQKSSAPVIPGDRSVEGIAESLRQHAPASAANPDFRDVTEASGADFLHAGAERARLLPEDMGPGVGLLDFDADGDLDIFAVDFEPLGGRPRAGRRVGHALFRNDGGWRFADVSSDAGIAAAARGLGVACADADGDGRIDIYVTCYGPNQLFRNSGAGTFREVAKECGVADEAFGAGAAFADYDLDGDLDLYVANYVVFKDDPLLRERTSAQGHYQIPFSINPSTYPPAPNVLFRNRGDGTFEDATAEAGVANPMGKSLGAVFSDLDGDGLPDIYVANDVSDNAYFLNKGGGRFDDVSYASHTADYRGAMGIAVRDYDGDGDLDFFITHWIAQENALYELMSRSPAGAPVYADVADYRGLGQVALDYVGWGTAFLDYDNDGSSDLIVLNGSTLEAEGNQEELVPQRPLLFWNEGTHFFEAGRRAGEFFRSRWNARGLAVGDLDGDGDEDLCAAMNRGKLRLLRNDTESANHWIAVDCRARGKNPFAVGARVTVVTGERTQTQAVGEQPSYLSSLPSRLHFGLGPAAVVDRISVRFPGGSECSLSQVPADQVLVVAEEE